ncbi:male sterility protein-domain-containing protein [Mycena rebaudengoi]|nr:male sterility protein-domain-containing protein [Mycena rebaudengoi]
MYQIASSMMQACSTCLAKYLPSTEFGFDTVSLEFFNNKSPFELSIEEIPLLGQIYPYLGHEISEDAFVPYPIPTTSIALDDVALYLHSSGSTGFPKSIPETHRNLIHHAALDGVAQMAEISPRLATGVLPAFNTLGITTQFLFPILNSGTACLYPLASTTTKYVIPVGPTAENAIENAKRANATGIMSSPEDLAYLKTLKFLGFAGGPLATRVGDFLFSQGVNLVPGMVEWNPSLPSSSARTAVLSFFDVTMFPFTSHAQCPDQDIHIHADRAAFHAARDSDGVHHYFNIFHSCLLLMLTICCSIDPFYCLCRTIPMRIAKMLGRWVELCAQLSSPHTPLQRRVHFLFGPLNVAAPALGLLYCALRATHWMELFARLHMMPAPRAGAFCSCLLSDTHRRRTKCDTTTVWLSIAVKRRQAEVDAGEWAWFRFGSRTNIRWVPQGDGTFECQFLTVPKTHKVSVENLPDFKGYSTKDLFERHPTKPDLYRIVGRLDDVLIMANGEKTVPGPMEDIIMSSPYIRGAVMFGRERNQVGVLVEPNVQYKMDPKDEKKVAQFRDVIWPVIEEANENAPAFARIYKEMILVTGPGRPMVRAPKGTVINKSTIALYKQDIEELYDAIEASGNAASDIKPPSSWSAQDLEPWLKTHASAVADRDIQGGHDLFDQGLDSLNATFLRHRIVAKAAAQQIAQKFIYAHPSIEELASAITALVHGESDSSDNRRKALVEAMITKYSKGFEEPIIHEKTVTSSGRMVVLLTGSTGGLGSHILEILLALPSVERVYAFNRRGRTPASERQSDGFLDCALDLKLLSSDKLIYLEGDTTKEDLGLPLLVWTTLRDTLTVIIHNAWTLDFNKTLSSFEPHVQGTRNLIDLARQSPLEYGVRFLFTSSIASAQSWDQSLGPFPEEFQKDASVALGNGYGEGKYVSERILAASGLEAISFRIGQVCGSASNGAWSTTDWVPAIVKSTSVKHGSTICHYTALCSGCSAIVAVVQVWWNGPHYGALHGTT